MKKVSFSLNSLLFSVFITDSYVFCMEVIRNKPGFGSPASRLAACRRCIILLAILFILSIFIGYYSVNKANNKIEFVQQAIRVSVNSKVNSLDGNSINKLMSKSEISNILSNTKSKSVSQVISSNFSQIEGKISIPTVSIAIETAETETVESNVSKQKSNKEEEEKDEIKESSEDKTEETKESDKKNEKSDKENEEFVEDKKSDTTEEKKEVNEDEEVKDSDHKEEEEEKQQEEQEDSKSDIKQRKLRNLYFIKGITTTTATTNTIMTSISSSSSSDSSRKETSERPLKKTDFYSLQSISSSVTTLLDYARGHHILAYGDSITYGSLSRVGIVSSTTNSPGMTSHSLLPSSSHPYTLKLSECVARDNIFVKAYGFPGRTTENLLDSLENVLEKTIIHRHNISIMIVLGGTNDLIQNDLSAQDILSNIETLHQKIHNSDESQSRSIYTIAMTIPYINLRQVNNKTRMKVNEGIHAYAMKCSHRVALLDLEFLYPYDTTSTNINMNTDEERIKYKHKLRHEHDHNLNFNHNLYLSPNRHLLNSEESRENTVETRNMISYLGLDNIHPIAAGYDEIGLKLFELLSTTSIDTKKYKDKDNDC